MNFAALDASTKGNRYINSCLRYFRNDLDFFTIYLNLENTEYAFMIVNLTTASSVVWFLVCKIERGD